MAKEQKKHHHHSRRGKPTETDLSELKDVFDYVVDLSEYRDMGSLGQGTFGKVWKGQSRVTDWTIAVKELLTEHLHGKDLEFYRREVRILVLCKDPFLLDFIGFTMKPPYSIVTSFMPCGSLWDAIHNKTVRLNAAQKTNIAMGMAHGMMYLHRHKIVHRDLKTPNILLDDRLLPKIADFGLGRFVTDCEAMQRMTGNIGTPIWMAPELLSDAEYGPPVDVYAYGMILYEMYTEKVPFSGLERMRIYRMVVDEQQRPDLPNPGSHIGVLIQQCWAHNAPERPTFEAIYAQFASRSVYFPGTHPAATAILVHEVQRDESIVDAAVVGLAQQLNEMLEMRRVARTREQKQDLLAKLAADGDVHQMTNLLTAYVNDIDVNAPGGDDQVPPLHAAVKAGQIVAVEYIVKIKRADKNVRDGDGNTPLIAAVKYGQERIVGFLAQCKDVDANAQNKFGWTALHVVALLDASWHAPMLAMIALAKDVRVDLEDWNGKKPFSDNPEPMEQFTARLQFATGRKY
jgi:serine/threonine protein kinase